MDLKPSYRAIDLIRRFEGCKLEAYHDVGGVPTIGYGHTEDCKIGDTITELEADTMLLQDLTRVGNELNKLIVTQLTQAEFDALCSLVYNIGIVNFKESTLLSLLNKGFISQAANEFNKWNKVNGKVVTGLSLRREAEKEHFLMNV